MASVSPLTYVQHAHLRLKKEPDYSPLAQQHMLPLLAEEMVSAARHFPIIFVKNSDTGRFELVGLLGFQPAENSYWQQGRWQIPFTPAMLQHYPLCLVPDQSDPEQFIMAINETSPRLNSLEGEPLFNHDGSASTMLEQVKTQLGSIIEAQEITAIFNAKLAELDLLTPKQLHVKLHNETLALDGLYQIDEQKLQQLAADEFLALRQRGFLPAIYAQIVSMQHLAQLVQQVAVHRRQ